jgi:hypothetical protein
MKALKTELGLFLLLIIAGFALSPFVAVAGMVLEVPFVLVLGDPPPGSLANEMFAATAGFVAGVLMMCKGNLSVLKARRAR